jgi:tetratricopeptide (TPR) repeat protein
MLINIVVFAIAGFWLLMLFDCIRHEPKGSIWLWILILLNFPGAVVYVFMRKLPELNWSVPNFFKRWQLRSALSRAEAGIYRVGDAECYVTLGNVLLEMGKYDRALESYQEASSREKSNPHALWGCALVAIHQQQFDRAAEWLKILLQQEPNYKSGAASLRYGKVLCELAQWDKARQQLVRDLDRWGHPESSLLLAKIAINDREPVIAKGYLENMLARLATSPLPNRRQHQQIVTRAQLLLKSIAK